MSTPASNGSRSAALLARLQAMPRLAVPVGVLALFLIGAFAPALYAVPALAVLVAFVGWLASLSWPALTRPARFVRGMIVGMLVALLVGRVLEGLA